MFLYLVDVVEATVAIDSQSSLLSGVGEDSRQGSHAISDGIEDKGAFILVEGGTWVASVRRR